jgi:hypothetical protein
MVGKKKKYKNTKKKEYKKKNLFQINTKEQQIIKKPGWDCVHNLLLFCPVRAYRDTSSTDTTQMTSSSLLLQETHSLIHYLL